MIDWLKDRGRTNRTAGVLAAMLLIAIVMGITGGYEAMTSVEPRQTSSTQPTFDHVADVGPGQMEWVDDDGPVLLEWGEGPSRDFSLQLHQSTPGDDGPMEVTIDVAGVETIESDGERRRVGWRWSPRGLDIRSGGAVVDEKLHRTVTEVLETSHVEQVVDSRGRSLETVVDGRTADRGGAAAGLVTAMLQLSMPRFPAERILVGESWHYEFETPTADVGPVPRIGVEARLDGFYEGSDGRVAAIDRRIRSIDDERVDATGEVEGRGTAYFDVDTGRLVASQWRIDRRTAEIELAWFAH